MNLRSGTRRLVRRAFRVWRPTVDEPAATLNALPSLTKEEDMFLHMLLMRDHGRARARGVEPSSLVRSLLDKRVVCWIPDGERFAIMMTELGWRVAQRRAGPG